MVTFAALFKLTCNFESEHADASSLKTTLSCIICSSLLCIILTILEWTYIYIYKRWSWEETIKPYLVVTFMYFSFVHGGKMQSLIEGELKLVYWVLEHCPLTLGHGHRTQALILPLHDPQGALSWWSPGSCQGDRGGCAGLWRAEIQSWPRSSQMGRGLGFLKWPTEGYRFTHCHNVLVV